MTEDRAQWRDATKVEPEDESREYILLAEVPRGAHCVDEHVWVGYFHGGEWFTDDESGRQRVVTQFVTHWMAIPEAPGQDVRTGDVHADSARRLLLVTDGPLDEFDRFTVIEGFHLREADWDAGDIEWAVSGFARADFEGRRLHAFSGFLGQPLETFEEIEWRPRG